MQSLVEPFDQLSTGMLFGDLSPRTRIVVAGEDGVRFINNLCTNDIARLQEAAGCEAFFCNAKGGILFYATIFKLRGELWIDSQTGNNEAFLKHLDRYLIREKVQLKDVGLTTCLVHVAGDRASSFFKEGLGFDPPTEELSVVVHDVDGQQVEVRRINRGWTGFDIVCDQSSRQFIDARLEDFPASKRIDTEQFERLRINSGIPMLGVDFQEGALPQEVDRAEQTISFTKGCYIGQETVARLDSYGHVNKILRALVIEGPSAPATGTPIQFGGKEVGILGSVARSLDDRYWVALATLRTAASKPGTTVSLTLNDLPIEAVVASPGQRP